MNLEDLLAAQPKLHVDEAGQTYSFQLLPRTLAFIDTQVHEGSRTLEVGAGVSTVLFALRGATHICIFPDTNQEVHNIVEFCRSREISLDRVTFEIGQSDQCLPTLTRTGFDLVLLDGGHGFPTPFLDFHYTAERLKVGGLLIVDDTQFWTGHTLKRFLLQESEWQVEVDWAPRCVVFRKTSEYTAGKNETFQPYVMAQSRALEIRRRTRAALGGLVPRRISPAVKRLARRALPWFDFG